MNENWIFEKNARMVGGTGQKGLLKNARKVGTHGKRKKNASLQNYLKIPLGW
ncbi:MAG TPA: hypothetical protein VGJ89_02630 [Geothrix sp.]